jgi:hypothetical protein
MRWCEDVGRGCRIVSAENDRLECIHFPMGTPVVDMSPRFRNEPAAQTFMLWLLFPCSKYSHHECLVKRK